MIGTSTWIPSAPLVFTYERELERLERLADEVGDLIACANPLRDSGGSRSKTT